MIGSGAGAEMLSAVSVDGRVFHLVDARRQEGFTEGTTVSSSTHPSFSSGSFSHSQSSSSFSSSSFSSKTLSSEPLFPLPLVAANRYVDRTSYPEGHLPGKVGRPGGPARRRRRRHVLLVCAINRCITRLNRAQGGCEPSDPTPRRTHAITKCAEEAVISIIRKTIILRNHLPDVEDGGKVLGAGEGLSSMPFLPAAGGGGAYHEVSANDKLVQLRDSEVALPETGAVVDFTDHVMADEFRSESGGALREEPPTKAELSKYRIHVAGNREEVAKILRRLKRALMMDFQEFEPKVVNGMFGVAKSDGKIRLIIDLRRGNLYFKGCKDLDLLNPAYLAEIIVEGDKVFIGQTDITNYFHMIRVPTWMSQYFGLPKVWSEDVGVEGPGRWVWPVIRSLPMGFVRSVEIAQNLREHLAAPAMPDTLEVIRNGKTRRLTSEKDLQGDYIDDGTTMGVHSAERVNETVEAMVRELKRWGLDEKTAKRVVAGLQKCTDVLGVGCRADGYLVPGTKNFVRTMLATHFVIRKKRCSSRVMARLVGSWVWPLLLNRTLLSLMDKVFQFVSDDLPTRQVPLDVLDELQSLLDVVPLLVVDLKRRPSKKVVATDASPTGQGVCIGNMEDYEFDHLARHAWLKGYTTRHDGAGAAEKIAELDPRYAPVADFVATRDWRTAVAHRFKWKGEHITLLEARAVLSGTKWLARQPTLHHRRVPFFVDSQACLGAFAKGRSPSRKLNRIVKRTAAYINAADLRMSWLWVKTDCNPADKPSRVRERRSNKPS